MKLKIPKANRGILSDCIDHNNMICPNTILEILLPINRDQNDSFKIFLHDLKKLFYIENHFFSLVIGEN